MRHATRIGRFGGLAVGLGIGAAVAATGTASADLLPPFDPNDFAVSGDSTTLFRDASAAATSGIGIGDIGAPVAAAGTASADPAAVALPPFDWNNFAVSIGGIPLIQVGSAHASSGGLLLPDIAIADGANASADAGFGVPFFPFNTQSFDFALASGADANAHASGNFASATVFGTSSTAAATGTDFGNVACVIGPNADAEVSGPFFNFASILNTGSGLDVAHAVNGYFDIASVVGTDSTAFAGGAPFGFGAFDLAAVFGDMLHAMATGGNFLVDILP